MSILSLDDYIAADKETVLYNKVAARSTGAAGWTSLFDLAGNPAAGTLAAGNTTAGTVPTKLFTAGYPTFQGAGNPGEPSAYLSKVDFSNSVPGRIAIFDRLYLAGAFAFNANSAISSPPSYTSRLPFKADGVTTDYSGVEIWVEQVTAATGNQAVSVSYDTIDLDGNPVLNVSTAATGIAAAPTIGRCWRLPIFDFQPVTKLRSVRGTVATGGTFNVMVLRRLWSGRVGLANGGDVHDLLKTGLPWIPPLASLYVMVCPDSTSTGTPDLALEIAHK